MKRISDLCNPQTNQYEPERSKGARYDSTEATCKISHESSSLRSTTSFHYSRPVSQSPFFNDSTSDICSIQHKPTMKKHTSIPTASKDVSCTRSEKNNDIETSALQRRNSMHIIGNQCERCGRIFNRRADMLKHVRVVHDRVKDFECEICGRKFGRKDYLSVSQHERLNKGPQESIYKY